jgi:hypothetical protein
MVTNAGFSVPDSFRDDHFYGLLAIQNGLATREQLDMAVDICLHSNPAPRLMDVLVRLARMPQAEALRIFEIFCSLLIGSIALRREYVTEEQLFEALEIQASTQPKPLLGSVLVDRGYITPDMLQQLIDAQESALKEALSPPSPAPAPAPAKSSAPASDGPKPKQRVNRLRQVRLRRWMR